MAKKSVISQLATVGEEAIGKLAQNPATHKAVQGALQLKERVDDLGKRVRGLESLEKRLVVLEKRLDKLEKPGKTPATRKSTSSSTTKKSSGASS